MKSRPIALPVFKSGRWYDDFAVTGASDPGYSLVGAKESTSGILLKATTGTSSDLSLPPWLNFKNFEAEMISRLISGTQTLMQFRYLNGSNRLFITINSSGNLLLTKGVGGTYTVLGSISGVSYGSWNRIGLRAVGLLVEVFLNGIKKISVTEIDNINNAGLIISSYNPTIGIAQSEFQYLAIKPL